MKSFSCTLLAGALLLGVTMPVVAADLAGEQLFGKYCVHCHGSDNEAAGTLQLARTRGKDKALLTERTGLSPEYVEYVVRHGLKAMPPFPPSDLTESQLRILAEYLSK